MSVSPEPGSFPPLRPVELTRLLGRDVELDQVLGLLDDPTQRLVTLTGPGGVGKTRLAMHIATTLVREFDRDVVHVPLAAIRDACRVLPTMVQALGLAEDSNSSVQERLVEALHQRTVLLVLDNFEQVLDASSDIARLLATCPMITMLVTSQTALGVGGEQLFPLAPLPTPSPELTTAASILRADAVALFVARARAVNPHLVFDDLTAITIGEICRKLDGLPLAIELAAARTNILSPSALLARLSNRLQVLGSERRDVPDRWRTMRRAIAWSYDLLTPEEQRLFRRLSVFSGGFSLEAVEVIFRQEGGDRDAFMVLGSLVDHSLVQSRSGTGGTDRYLILETLRAYGLEQIEAQDEAYEVGYVHAEWCVSLAERSEAGLMGSEQEVWLHRLDPEWDNIRTAVEWSLARDDHAIPLRIFGAIWRFCSARGHTSESRVLLERALAASVSDHSRERGRGLVAAGNLALTQSDLGHAQVYLEQASGLAVSIGDASGEIESMIGLAKVAVNRSDYATAIAFHQRAADLARENGELRSFGISLGGLAYVAYFQGRLDDAVRYWEEARQVVAVLGDGLLEAVAASNLGAVALVRGDYEQAKTLLTRVLELQRRMQAFDAIPYTLTNLAETWRNLGDYTLAEDMLAEAISRFRELGYTGSEGTCLTSYAQLAFDLGDHSRAAMMLMESTRLIHEAGDQFPITENADLLAEIIAARETPGAAIELLAASTTIRNAMDAELKPIQLAHQEALQRILRQAVTDASFEEHWRTGTTFQLDSLVRRITVLAREVVGVRYPQPLIQGIALPEAEHPLTNRELEVLRLLTEGRSTRAISDALFISPRTTTTHINNILGKLEVSSRSAAVAHALRNGLV